MKRRLVAKGLNASVEERAEFRKTINNYFSTRLKECAMKASQFNSVSALDILFLTT